MNAKRKCGDCKETKFAEEFNKDRSKQDGLQVRCRDCQKVRSAIARDAVANYLDQIKQGDESVNDTAIRHYVSHRNHEAFYSKIEVADSCWIWNAYLRPDGYGHFSVPLPGGGFTILAHRLSYALEFGYEALPKSSRQMTANSLCLDHLCMNRRCVNPYHIQIITLAENSSYGGGRAR